MPRPGPRPYECVRRAWHSDRHQPMRGSLIQEIFRVVNEVHKPATKKNKEWQEKLPVVVLRAEEILYSKANSEAEYMDLKTLWDRTNDAIDTIIRRDESTETGEFLQPCIEAALNLGCTPQRTSRSQRNTNTRCYLTPCSQDPKTLSPGIQAIQETNSRCIPNYPYMMKSTVPKSHLVSDLQNLACQSSNKFLFPSYDVPSSKINRTLPLKNLHGLRFCSTLPSYHDVCLEPQHDDGAYPCHNEPGKTGIVHDFFSTCSSKAPSIAGGNGTDDHHDMGISCDLSLRLGSLSASKSSENQRKLCDRTHQTTSKSKSSSSTINMDNSFGSYSSTLSGDMNVDMTPRKRKAAWGHELVKHKPYSWQAKLPCNYLTDGMNSGS